MTPPTAPILLRALEPQDVDTLYEWENDPTVWSVGITLAPYSRRQLWDYVNSYDADIYAAKQLRLMVVERESGMTVGTIDLFDFDPANSRCGVGILIAPEFQRRGYGEATLQAIADYCRSRLSLHQLYCTVGAGNAASRALFEKCGFSISGRLRSWIRRGGRYEDAYLYQKML